MSTMSRIAALAFFFLVLMHHGRALASGALFQGNGKSEARVTGHRMALALSPERTVLWDEIVISGAPEELAWILPVRPAAYLELSSEAWLDTLDDTTATRIVAPQLDCAPSQEDPGWEMSCGCPIPERTESEEDPRWSGTGQSRDALSIGTSGGQSVGPYEIVRLRGAPGVAAVWLRNHGFTVDERVAAVFDAYASEGYDFIVLRLRPGQGASHMQPVRVVTSGFEPMLPLRMVSAGIAERAAMTLFVIAERRWQTASMPTGVVDERDLVWDFRHSTSNYERLRSDILGREGGRGWLTSYAQRGALAAAPLSDAIGELPDLSIALTGTRPDEVWLTRIEADLPREVLSEDLILEAAPEQAAVESWLYPPRSENAPCPTIAAGAIVPRRSDAPSRVTILSSTVIALIAAATARRAARRKGLHGNSRL